MPAYLVAFVGGGLAQATKVLTFLVIEKRLNFRRFVQADGMPNMHSAAMTALALAVGFADGFRSPSFAVALCFALVVMVDTMKVRRAASLQEEAIGRLVARLRRRAPRRSRRKSPPSYTPLDVLMGSVVGALTALILVSP
jgi:hypothetical protein